MTDDLRDALALIQDVAWSNHVDVALSAEEYWAQHVPFAKACPTLEAVRAAMTIAVLKGFLEWAEPAPMGQPRARRRLYLERDGEPPDILEGYGDNT